jgi:transposase
VTAALANLHKELEPYYSDIGRPSIDPELKIRMLIVGCCYGIRSERRLTQEVELHLACRWFCKLDREDEMRSHTIRPSRSTGWVASARASAIR